MRYIDADVLLQKSVEERHFFISTRDAINDGYVVKTIYDDLADVIASIPTADAAEVKHGEWEQGDYYDIGDVCSVCQYESRIEPCEYNYCPNCGAKMDGKESEDGK